MKTPITYYGGKQRMAKYILPNLYKERTQYIEPFFGGGAIYFLKEKEKHEVINDLSDFVINFYRVLQTNCEALYREVNASLYSETLHRKATFIYNNPIVYDEVLRAWAFFYLCNTTMVGAGDGHSPLNVNVKHGNGGVVATFNKKKLLLLEAGERLANATIICNDAIDVINVYNREGSFFYLDPPYVASTQEYKNKYKQEDLDLLLETCKNIKGHFLLSCYNNEAIDKAVAECGWHKKEYDMVVSVNRAHTDTQKIIKTRKTEILVANYDLV